MLVVFDTDVLIPLVLPASRSTRLFDRLRAAGHKVVLAPSVLEEVQRKLREDEDVRKWLSQPDELIETFLSDLPTLCVVTPGQLQITGLVPADPKDDHVISAALESGAAYIVTEDKAILARDGVYGVRIMDRPSFAEELSRLGVPPSTE
jgi:putative PIN family toxin of toxin-antitoxin system